MTYEEALQIAKEELDEKIEYLSDTFKGHSARVESYIYDLSMARKALMQASKEKREWVGLTEYDIQTIEGNTRVDDFWATKRTWNKRFAEAIQDTLKRRNT